MSRLPFVLASLVALNVSTQSQAATAPPAAAAAAADTSERYKNLELFQKIIHYVESKYVDPVNNKELIYGAIKGMIDALDPHSSFLLPETLKEMKSDTAGKFGGLGIELGVKDGVLTVIAPIEDTPAWKAGIKPNDRIVKIQGQSTKGMNLQDAVTKMRGKKGESISITIFREGFQRAKDLTLTRAEIKIRSVKSEVLEPGYGYIRLSGFNENASSDVRRALEQFEKAGRIKGLVLDLRLNPGGLLDQAVAVSELFIEGLPVVITKGRTGVVDTKFARKGKAYLGFPMAVLVNSSSASAAEIVAGALQDHRRAIILGQPTFGKGSVQEVVELGGGLGLKLTIQRYYTPSGRSIQEKGVQPDLLLDDYDPKLLAEARRKSEFLREKDLRNHMTNPDADESVDASLTQSAEVEKQGPSGTNAQDWAPIRFKPLEDYQVQMALKTIRSFDVFKGLVFDRAPVQSQTPATASK